MTCDPELERVQQQTRPRSGAERIDFGPEFLAKLESVYDQHTVSLEAQQATILRAQATGVLGNWDYPLPWACLHLKRCLERNLIDWDNSQDFEAICTVIAFASIHSTWGHHPRCERCIRSLKGAGTFWHLVFQMATAGYMYQAGNTIGIAVEDGAEPTPDLYVRLTAIEKLHIEIKMPKKLRWPEQNTLDAAETKASIKKALKSSYKQLNRSRPGILVVGTCAGESHGSQAFRRSLAAIGNEVIRSKGRDHKDVAAIVTVSLVYPRNLGGAVAPMGFNFHRSINPHYRGQNPFA